MISVSINNKYLMAEAKRADFPRKACSFIVVFPRSVTPGQFDVKCISTCFTSVIDWRKILWYKVRSPDL
jgi:hypothetical protein